MTVLHATKPLGQRAARTDGVLWNRRDHADTPNLYRSLNPRLDARGNKISNNKGDGGYDWTSYKVDDSRSFDIPNTSVTRKVSDVRIPYCRVPLTAAQVIWLLNLFCAVAHGSMVAVTLWAANRDGGKDLSVTVYRIRANWTGTTTNGYAYELVPNGLPIDLGVFVAAFFGISFVFHTIAVCVGPFERFWPWYWRQIDKAWCPWRWVEYSLSASLMALLIALSIGLREENTLACVFMLHFCTMLSGGLLTEYVSRPRMYPEQGTVPVGKPNELYIIDQLEWEGDPRRGKLTKEQEPFKNMVQTSYFLNFCRRMLPFILAIFPFVTAWTCILKFLITSSFDVEELHGSGVRIPDWVVSVIVGTVVIFSSFTVVIIVFQWLPPAFYYGTELIYSLLSLTAKMYLGVFVLINIFFAEGSAEAILDGKTS